MSENRIGTILEGTPYKTALAYLNTLRRIYDDIDQRVRDIDSHLGRIADGYCTDIADGIAIARDVNALLRIMDNIQDNIDAIGKAVDSMENKEESK